MHGPFGRAANCQRQFDKPPRLRVERAASRDSFTEALVCGPYLRIALGHAPCTGRKIALHFFLAYYAAKWRRSISIDSQNNIDCKWGNQIASTLISASC